MPRLIVAGCLLSAVGLALLPGPLSEFPQFENPVGLPGSAGDLLTRVAPYPLLLITPILTAVSAASLLLRFWRATGIERQQLKWFGFTIGVVVVTAPVIFSGVLGSWGDLFGNFGFACVPISIAVAVLRYRLYEIDRIINRALVYGFLSIGLGATYWLSVVLLQQVLRPLTQGSDLAIVGSTLAVAALFQPLRRRIQAIVDRRFYRQRYDAGRTLEAFSARLRDEIDLDALGDELTDVIRRTMQPTSFSLWLKTPQESGAVTIPER